MLNLDDDDGATRQRLTAHEYVKERLRRGILRGSIPSGSRLVQADIATQLRVSTTPVREALRDLSTEGIIRLDPHRGAVVRELDAAEVSDIYDLRGILEPEAMRRVARNLDSLTRERAENLLTRMEEVEEPGTWTDLNREFHELLVQAVDSPRMKSILVNLQDSAAPYVGFSLGTTKEKIAAANMEHRELLESLREGDGEQAAAITSKHLRSTLRTLRQNMAARRGDDDGGATSTDQVEEVSAQLG